MKYMFFSNAITVFMTFLWDTHISHLLRMLFIEPLHSALDLRPLIAAHV